MIPIAKPLIGDEEKRAVLDVLDSGMIAQGPRVRALEEEFAAMCGVNHAVATTSGTTALHMALHAHGIGSGDEVITTPFTFIASANSILFVGAKPVFVDIDPLTFNIDVAAIEDAITPRTRAIMVVHLFGLCCDMLAIMEIAARHDLLIIEDACQSHGAMINERKAGSWSTAAFSFYPTKNMTSGEGGMITTNDPDIAENCRVFRQHGMRRRYYHDELGYNFRMTDLHAAVGLEQLRKLNAFNAARQKNANYLSKNLLCVETPYVPDGYTHVYHQFSIRVRDGRRDELVGHLKENDVGFGIYYPVPIHKQTYYVNDLGYDQTLPESERAAAEIISLPVHPALSQEDLEKIVSTVNAMYF